MEFKMVVFAICAIIVLFLIFKEIKRSIKVNLSFRILANFLMMISFAFLIVPITYQTVNEQAINELNLITEGTSIDTIAQIIGDKYELDSNLLLSHKNLKTKHIEDLAYYLQENKDIKKVNIYGYGLAELHLKQLQNYQVSFHPETIPQGFISAGWQKKIKVTENLNVQGVYNNTTNQDVNLKLFGLGANLDSTIIKANSKSTFSFNNQPKLAGKAIYQLIAFKGIDTIATEPIPFEVTRKQPIRVLILASFPDFEYKFLKNWLYENQYQVVFRSQISKDKYSSDFLNRKAIGVNRINQDLLKQMDVLVIDEDELSAITAGERANINTAVSNGMGLIIRLTNAKPNANSPNYGRFESRSATLTGLSINEVNKNIKFSELPFPQTLFLQSTINEQAMFKSASGKIIVNTQLYGMGKIIVSTLAATYQWELAGNKTDYANFWSTLFSKASRKEVKNESIELYPQFLTIGNSARLITNLTDSKVPELYFNDVKLNPKQNMEIPLRWDAVFWPTIVGWNKVTINNTIENAFVYQPTDWLALKYVNTIKLNSNFSINQSNLNKDLKQAEQNVIHEISKWWFFIIFILTASYLWYEQRFLAK